MASRNARRLVGVALVCVLASPLIVVGEGRKNPRDFPDGTLCAVNPGWSVDPVSGDVVEPKTLRPPLHTFTATGANAEISLVACDRGLTNDHEFGLDVVIRDFAVIRQDIYSSYQAASGYAHDPLDPFANSCYFALGGEDPFARLVGSTFDPDAASPAVKPQTLKFPFFDDFSNLALSARKWQLDGAAFEEVTLNDPRQPATFLGNALVLARGVTDPAQDSCSMARVVVRHLRKNQNYVIDFQWQSRNTQNVPDVQMLTFVDTNP